MWITDIRIDGFGVWNTVSVDELSPGITLFYGPNEAGKTTLMQFIRAVLYGFSPDRRRLYLPPVFGGVPGGLIRAENHNGGFVIERRESEKDREGDGRVIVLSDNGSRQGQHLLNVLVSGIDESIFNNVFAIGIRELQELATLNDTQAAEQLYKMASGVDRVSLVEVMRHLETSRDAIWNAEQPAELSELFGLRDRLRGEISELRQETERWVDLSQQRRSLVLELAQLNDRIETTKFSLRTVEIAKQVRAPWERRAEVISELEDVGSPELLAENCLEQLAEINRQADALREQLLPHRKRRQAIKRELAAQPIHRALWDHSCRIEAICEHGPWIASLDDEIKQLRESVESAEIELIKHEESLTGESGLALSSSPGVTATLMRQLQPVGQSLRDALQKRAIARKVHRKSRQDVDEMTADLRDELEGRTVEDFDELLDRASHLTKTLRRLVQLEDHVESAEREKRGLDEDYDEILDDQIQNVRILAGIGGMFVFGFVLTLTGIFGWKLMPMTAELCFGVAGLGAICIILSIAWKIVLERTSQEELDDCMERREESESQIETVIREQDGLLAEIPEGRGTLASRLTDAERDLRELEEKAPLQDERQLAEKRKSRSVRHASGAEEDLRDARRRWRRALREAGLPETLTPKLLRQLAAHYQRKSKLEAQLSEKRGRSEKLSGDRDALVDRLHQLTADVGLTGSITDPQILLSQLGTALAGQKEMARARREFQREEKQLKRDLGRRIRQLRGLDRSRDSLFAAARVADEEELTSRAMAIELRQRLEQQHAVLCDQIQSNLIGHCSEAEVSHELEQNSPDDLERRQQALRTSLQTHQAHLAQAHQRHGEINQEMKTLAENKRLATAQFELARAETKIKSAIGIWRNLSATLRLLEDIRETYEVERQPETLSEASLYLERLTAGKYGRIWTPLGKNELRIDDQDGNPLSLDVLSRGTREIVFLALRLALVAAYGRRGINVPMVLDDVLVNLDVKRAEAAVDVLCDFAREGRQLLFYTCHEHVKAMFVAAGVDARDLPAHQSPGVHVVPLLERRPIPSDREEVVEEPEEEEEFEEPELAVEAEVEAEADEEIPEIFSQETEQRTVEVEGLVDEKLLDLEAVYEEFGPPEQEEEEPEVVAELAKEEDEEEDEVEVEEEEEVTEIEFEPAPVSELSDPQPYEADDFWWWDKRSFTQEYAPQQNTPGAHWKQTK